MSTLKKKFPALLCALLFNSSTLFGNDLLKTSYVFKDISVNYLDWTSSTEQRSFQRDFGYLELEGGAGFSWGDIYGFADLENPTRSYDGIPMSNRRYVFKPVIDIKLFDSAWYLYAQDYNLYSKDFYVSNFIAGLSYKYIKDGLLFQPFLAPHYQQSTYYSGFNGYMFGWLLNYDFSLNKQKFTISQWHENEFNRVEKHYLLDDGSRTSDGESYGVQGALSLWWHPINEITTGIQYRYALYKLGYYGYQDGFIYTLKYNF
jgi:hypothetical protein